MAFFAGYGFNKSHSAAYALVAYHTAWLKTHHPTHFMAAVLTMDKGNTDKLVKYINECREMGIEVSPPDVNASGLDFTVERGIVSASGCPRSRTSGRRDPIDSRSAQGASGSFDSCTSSAPRSIFDW